MVKGTLEFSAVGSVDDMDDSSTEDEKGSKWQKRFVLFVIILMLCGLAVGLYFILRPQPESLPIINERGQRILPCPRSPGLKGNFTKTSCNQQPNCKWVEYNTSLAIPYNCTYDVDTSAKVWTLKEENSNISWKSYSLAGNNNKLKLEIYCRTENELRLKISDSAEERYEVPTEALPIRDEAISCNLTTFSYSISTDEQIFMLIHNNVTMLSIPFDQGFVFDEQFMQLTLRLNSPTNYGFGEHNHRQLKLDMNYKTWSIFTRDVAPVDEWNLYGAQPYFMSVSSQHKYVVGTLLKNSNAMDVYLQPHPYPSVTYKVIGGIFDFHFLVDTNPESVTQHYTSLVGRPLLPPYWSLGFQLSRWGYQNTTHVKEVVKRNQNAGIPLDVVYGDIDYMSDKLDFTIDITEFGELPAYVEELYTKHKIRYIIILDPGIGIEQDKIKKLQGGEYKALEDGLSQNIFIKESNGSNLVGKVWPGLVHYPDFTEPKTTEWWKDQIKDFHDNTRNVSDAGLRFDGLWVDMNEPSNFRDGKAAEEVCDMTNKLNSPPYIPENLLGNSLVDKTICMDSDQKWGKHYNVHSLYGHSMAQSTYRALEDLFPSRRPFVLTRSTFAGTGKYAIHWLGDNQSQWRQVPWSIVSMLEYSMFGFSMTGSDICGFWYNTTEALCQRWMQLGAFYPLARNHNAGFNSEEIFLHLDQDPARFSQAMIKSSRDILMTRYKLLPYLYTLMYQAHTTGSTVARPLFHEFMEDNVTHTVDRQFLWGPALLISPCLEESSVEVDAYFPEGTWYNYFTGVEVRDTKKWTKLHTPLDKINLHVRGGYVIPWQTPDVTTELSKWKPFGLLIALNSNGQAYGQLYLDAGDSPDPIKAGNYNLVAIEVSYSQVEINLVNNGYSSALNTQLATVQVLGVGSSVSEVIIDSGAVTNFSFSHDSFSKVMTIDIADTGFTYQKNHTITWATI